MEVYVVSIEGREDGLYVFRYMQDAVAFANAAEDAARSSDGITVSTEPVISHGSESADLIEAELESR